MSESGSQPGRRVRRTRAPDREPAATGGSINAEPSPGVGAASPVYWPKTVRYRPTSHRIIGGCELALALALIVFAYAGGFGYRPLPIGPIWYQVVGWMLAYYSTSWFGWWDRPK